MQYKTAELYSRMHLVHIFSMTPAIIKYFLEILTSFFSRKPIQYLETNKILVQFILHCNKRVFLEQPFRSK